MIYEEPERCELCLAPFTATRTHEGRGLCLECEFLRHLPAQEDSAERERARG